MLSFIRIDDIIVNNTSAFATSLQLRDPPPDGVFVYGFYVWNASWDRTSAELADAPPKQTPCQLPVVHLTFTRQTDKQGKGAGGPAAGPGGLQSIIIFSFCFQ